MKHLLLLISVLLFSGCEQAAPLVTPAATGTLSPTATTTPSPEPLTEDQKKLVGMTKIPTPVPKQSACKQDVIICPNSSVINREGKDCGFATCPLSPVSQMVIYRNPTLGFQITFPPAYKAVTDPNGWPKEVVLLYKGGQSYDLAVELFNTQAEIDKKYIPPQPNLTVKTIGGKMITLYNTNNTEEVDQIIQSFEVVK